MLTLIADTADNEAAIQTDSDDLFTRLQFADNLLLWATIYLVKASFLALIWNIFKVSKGFRKAWWIVSVYTFITFWIVFLQHLWLCGSPSNYDDQQACDLNFTNLTGIVICIFALHISSDLFIIALPQVQVRKLSMPLSRKVNVAAIFAIGIIDTMIGIARNVATVLTHIGTSTDAAIDVDNICGVVEPALAVIVCSLPAYKALVFRFRSHWSRSLSPPRAAAMAGRWWKPRKLVQLTVSVPSPLLEFSTLEERQTQDTE